MEARALRLNALRTILSTELDPVQVFAVRWFGHSQTVVMKGSVAVAISVSVISCWMFAWRMHSSEFGDLMPAVALWFCEMFVVLPVSLSGRMPRQGGLFQGGTGWQLGATG
uniref:Uncharacterized protein n=1 Tax=Anopheles farauti TaxID=69004 RepID=A0A182Q420_9DIPT